MLTLKTCLLNIRSQNFTLSARSQLDWFYLSEIHTVLPKQKVYFRIFSSTSLWFYLHHEQMWQGRHWCDQHMTFAHSVPDTQMCLLLPFLVLFGHPKTLANFKSFSFLQTIFWGTSTAADNVHAHSFAENRLKAERGVFEETQISLIWWV